MCRSGGAEEEVQRRRCRGEGELDCYLSELSKRREGRGRGVEGGEERGEVGAGVGRRGDE